MEDDDPYKGLDNESRAYVGMHDAMMKLFADKKFKECAGLAEKLLTVSQPRRSVVASISSLSLRERKTLFAAWRELLPLLRQVWLRASPGSLYKRASRCLRLGENFRRFFVIRLPCLRH